MKPVLLIDFGSTYTKLTAVDVESETLLGTASAYTTIKTDVGDGLKIGLAALARQIGTPVFAETYACSSAAGGLRMITSGLVPELTSEAARRASLGAGAKVVGVYSFQLTEDDIQEIGAARPDILLLVGGIDGGNADCILHNARMLAALPPEFPVVIAGNRSAARACERILEPFETHLCENVMPKFGALNVEPAQKQIREIFLRRIVRAKGLSRAETLLSDILMPTPSAAALAMNLLSRGYGGEAGIGDLIAVDVGGATTDVYSVADGMPECASTVCKGLPEPVSKRTVEGDLGMRYGIRGIVEAAGLPRICALSGLTKKRAEARIDELAAHPETLPDGDPELERLDFALAALAVETAVARHAGTVEETYTLLGKTYVQTGKDLRSVGTVVVTGGSLIHTPRTAQIAASACYSPASPMSLRPRRAEILVDRRYILAAMGLLSTHYPETALRIMKKGLEANGYSE
ncbi:MAG: methylaspartate mutase accessory protein GlmL [Oscillospiraceae bacterium]|nr:methylaspartate mutase accessory protein GlmL [Oscillospiraceae bacterium]